MTRWIRVALLAATLAFAAAPAQGQLEGYFEAIGAVPAKDSADVVVFEEYFNFTCPHCNNFRTAAQPLMKKFGDRLRVVNIPVLFRGQNDAALRLFFVAQQMGLEREMKTAIFDATFRYGVNINDPSVVNYLARSAGVGEAYASEGEADWVTEKVQRSGEQAQAAGITATPTVVLQGTLRVLPQGGMDAFVRNLDGLIGQMLRE